MASEHEKLLELRALSSAGNDSVRIAAHPLDSRRELDPEHYLIPRGIWRSIVKAAKD